MKNYLSVLLFTFLISCSYKSDLPVLSYKLVNGNKKFYKLNNFQFTNQDNSTITPISTIGNVHTFNFFFTSCPSICPPMRIKQLELMNIFIKETNFKQLSISIDLKRDSVAQLKNYAQAAKINSNKWNLLRANNNQELQKMAQVLKSNFTPNKNGTDFYHSSYLALADKKQQIRGFYDILNPKEFDLLIRDIKDLLKE